MARWELLLLSPPGHVVEAFLGSTDTQRLALVSKLLHASGRLPRQRPVVSARAFPLAEAREWTVAKVHAVLSRNYYASKGSRKPNQRHGRLSLAQLTVLLDQILLVSSGIRTACLIDHCLLQPDLVEFLLEALDRLGALSSHDDVVALFLGDNVFFVSVPLFIQEKALGLASGFRELLFVNASASQGTPTLNSTVHPIANASSVDVSLPARNAMKPVKEVMLALCMELLDAHCAQPPRRVIEWAPRSRLSRTAIAGLILGYPAVYDVSNEPDPPLEGAFSPLELDASSSEWKVEGNCLAMCPLVVVQASLSIAEEQALPLQEFSVPQHLLLQHQCASRTRLSRRPLSLLPVLKAACRRRMERALQASSFGFAARTLRLQLDASKRTLPQVAL